MKIKNRIFFSIFLSSVLTLILTLLLLTRVVFSVMTDELQTEIKNEAEFISSALNSFESFEEAATYINEISKKNENRITLCRYDGTVIYDSFADISSLENHMDRPEISDALKYGSGSSLRASETIGEQTFYYAVRTDDQNIIRIANTSKSVMGLLGNSIIQIIIITLFIIGISLCIAVILSKTVIKPINDIDLDDPVSNKTYDEISPLLTRMDKQNKKINSQIEELSEQKKELSYIMENMSEGIVIYGEHGNILSANHKAEAVFEAKGSGTYPVFCRAREYTDVVEAALKGEKSSSRFEKNGCIYRLAASPVSSLADYGAVLFIIDITVQENAERMRREFSANVSHELKTPLTSIMGAAELIETGIAKPEDIPHFAEKIHTEANRLLVLIQDIIKISRLDEGNLNREFEELRFDDICHDAVSELYEKADSKNISLESDIDEVTLSGVRPVLHEMVCNLIDNGISYNKNGGYVKISLKKTENGCILKVSDNGIGIPAEHQARIFERFYRVDKSRSKETGGTGLGLSIVKHGAALHNGTVSLKSKVGKGTEITVSFENKISSH